MKRLFFLIVTIMGLFNEAHGQGRINIIDSKFKTTSNGLPAATSVLRANKSIGDLRFGKYQCDIGMLCITSQSSGLFRQLLSLEYKTLANPAALQLMLKPEFGDKQAYGAFISYSIPKSNISIGLMPGLEKWQWACNVSFFRSF